MMPLRQLPRLLRIARVLARYRVDDLLRERSVLRQEAVAGVDGRAEALGGGDDQVAAQVRVGRRGAGQSNNRRGLAHERRVFVGIAEHGDGGDGLLAAGAEDAPGDLASVGDQDGVDGVCVGHGHHIRNTP